MSFNIGHALLGAAEGFLTAGSAGAVAGGVAGGFDAKAAGGAIGPGTARAFGTGVAGLGDMSDLHSLLGGGDLIEKTSEYLKPATLETALKLLA